MTDVSGLRRALADAGQSHALARLDGLADEGARSRLAAQLAALDLDLVQELYAKTKAPPRVATSFEPPELFPLVREATRLEESRRASVIGSELLAAGKVGYVLVAGGQASRLGYDAPKGDFPLGPVTGRTLFAWHAARLAAAARRHETRVPWYVMTSPANDAGTRAIFEREGYYGLDPTDVSFFSQDMLPALDEQGRLLFRSEDELFLAPNGHGGSLLGLARSGALDDMRARGIELVSYFQVDNPLARPADPLFIGLHADARAGMSTKVVKKRDPGEKVGVIGYIDGVLGCIEYSDLPEELREARDPGGELSFRAGNIAAHVLSVDFVEELTRGGLSLPWHVAHKAMRVHEDGREVERMGFKFETFVFDALGESESSVTLEVDRELEFSPVKNQDGSDSPASARADLARLFAGWVRAAGRELPPPDADGNVLVEVDPRVAESQDEFLDRATAPDVLATGHLYGH